MTSGPTVAGDAVSPEPEGGIEMTCREAATEALRMALSEDPTVILMGEDVGAYGGCFAVSADLLSEFGPDRIRDTPLSEAGFVGAGIGAAMGGLHPIVEIMTVNFSLLALDQVVNNAATVRHMSGGQIAVPLVIRIATGGGRQLAAQHSHALEGWFAHIVGLKVWVPGTAQDFRWMLPAALADPDPVIVFEPTALYPTEGLVHPENPGPHPERAILRRHGDDLTMITYGSMVPLALDCADSLAEDGVGAEVLDLRSLRPLDDAAIADSIRRTHRVVVIDEGWRSGGISAEILARIAERSLYELDAPVARVCGLEVPTPYPAHLEIASRPSRERVLDAARGVLAARLGP